MLSLESDFDEDQTKAGKLVPDKLLNEEKKQEGVKVTKLKQEFSLDRTSKKGDAAI